VRLASVNITNKNMKPKSPNKRSKRIPQLSFWEEFGQDLKDCFFMLGLTIGVVSILLFVFNLFK
jgi:hypothetical protein